MNERTILLDVLPTILAGAEVNLRRDGRLLPVMLLNQHGRLGILPLFWRRAEDKEDTAHLLEKLIRAGDAWEYAIINEAWVMRGSADGAAEMQRWIAEHGTAEGAPGCLECAVLMYGSAVEEFSQTAEILTGADGGKHLGPWDKTPNARGVAALSSRFNGLWDKAAAGSN